MQMWYLQEPTGPFPSWAPSALLHPAAMKVWEVMCVCLLRDVSTRRGEQFGMPSCGAVYCAHIRCCECAQGLVVKGWHTLAVPISGLFYKGSSGFSLVFVEHVNTVLL